MSQANSAPDVDDTKAFSCVARCRCAPPPLRDSSSTGFDMSSGEAVADLLADDLVILGHERLGLRIGDHDDLDRDPLGVEEQRFLAIALGGRLAPRLAAMAGTDRGGGHRRLVAPCPTPSPRDICSGGGSI